MHALIKAYVKTFDTVKCTNVSVKCHAWILLNRTALPYPIYSKYFQTQGPKAVINHNKIEGTPILKLSGRRA